MRIVFVILLSLLDFALLAQQKNWGQTRNWRLYDIHVDKALGYNLDTVSKFQSVKLEDSIVQGYLTHATAWPKQKYATWMGAFIASYEDSTQKRKLDISMYGGFIFDENSRQYFELPLYLRKDWMEFLNSAFERMPPK